MLGQLDPDCSARELERVWPDLMPTVSKLLQANTTIDRGIKLLAATTEEAPEIYVLHLTQVCKMMSTLMTSQASNLDNMQLLIKSIGNIAPICSQDALGEFRLLVPKILAALENMVKENPVSFDYLFW